MVVSAAVSPKHSTAVDQPGVFGYQGLRSGTYNESSRFTIESRDRFSNRVLVGPLKEVQVVTTQCEPSPIARECRSGLGFVGGPRLPDDHL